MPLPSKTATLNLTEVPSWHAAGHMVQFQAAKQMKVHDTDSGGSTDGSSKDLSSSGPDMLNTRFDTEKKVLRSKNPCHQRMTSPYQRMCCRVPFNSEPPSKFPLSDRSRCCILVRSEVTPSLLETHLPDPQGLI